MSFAKVIAAFVTLLNQFISEGLTWSEIPVQLESIRSNVLRLRRLTAYTGTLFVTGTRQLPDAEVSAIDDYRFLDANRRKPTSLEKIRRARNNKP